MKLLLLLVVVVVVVVAVQSYQFTIFNIQYSASWWQL